MNLVHYGQGACVTLPIAGKVSYKRYDEPVLPARHIASFRKPSLAHARDGDPKRPTGNEGVQGFKDSSEGFPNVSNAHPQLRDPPIIEAVVDIDCDLPPQLDFSELGERTRKQFADRYPKFRTRFMQELEIQTSEDPQGKISSRSGIAAFQCLHDDEKQLVQVRPQGFSFNRLAPYSTLDDYLPEVELAWRLYVDLLSPLLIRVIRLRYINRIRLPLSEQSVDLDEFLKIGPRLPDEDGLRLSGFLSQQHAVDVNTRHEVNLVLSSQASVSEKLPIVLDITVAAQLRADPAEWSKLLPVIKSLRTLKNRIFFNSLKPKCIELFQS